MDKLNKRVVCIGMGYVGLTVSLALAKTGLKVSGVEKNLNQATAIMNQTVEIDDEGLPELLKQCLSDGSLTINSLERDYEGLTYFLITVGTPFESNSPNLEYVNEALKYVLEFANPGDCVVIRSTVQIGTTRTLFESVQDTQNGMLHFTMCPERTIEGHAITELFSLPQVISAIDNTGLDLAKNLFSELGCEIVIAESVEAAEFIKLMSNTYRDVNFAFSNEMAKIAEPWKINSQEAIRLSNYKYPRCNIQNPGLTGGPCLEKDPRILSSSAFKVGIDTPITNSARDTNETLPYHFIKSIDDNFPNKKFSKFGILGLAFKGNPATSDTRGSLSLGLRDAIISNYPEAFIYGYDDLIRSNSPKLDKISVVAKLQDFIDSVEIVIIQNNNHKMIKDFTDLIFALAPDKPIYDFWNVFTDEQLNALSNTKIFGRG